MDSSSSSYEAELPPLQEVLSGVEIERLRVQLNQVLHYYGEWEYKLFRLRVSVLPPPHLRHDPDQVYQQHYAEFLNQVFPPQLRELVKQEGNIFYIQESYFDDFYDFFHSTFPRYPPGVSYVAKKVVQFLNGLGYDKIWTYNSYTNILIHHSDIVAFEIEEDEEDFEKELEEYKKKLSQRLPPPVAATLQRGGEGIYGRIVDFSFTMDPLQIYHLLYEQEIVIPYLREELPELGLFPELITLIVKYL